MTRHFLVAVFLLGAAAVVWVGAGFVGSDALAFAVTLIIGAVYTLGFVELQRFRQATATLSAALANIPAGITSLQGWLNQVSPTLQNSVRLRIEGERVALPGPVFTPYLVGLLVMLGLLGTFLGMVVTLQGAVFALEATTELQAIRAGLTAPIKGLGMAFGTSVAGIAASAMLGLMSTISRRERMQATAVLDREIASTLRSFSLTHNRQETFQALQMQARALPELVDRLHAMSGQMERVGQQLGETLIAGQHQFQQTVQNRFMELASTVEKSLHTSLAESGRLTGDLIQPILTATLTEISREARQTQQQLSAVTQQQLQAFSATAASQQETTCAALVAVAHSIAGDARSQADGMLQQITGLLQASETLVHARVETEQNWIAGHSARMQELAAVMQAELGALRAEEEVRGRAAVARLSDLETALVQHLSTLGIALEQPMTRLVQMAAEVPQAAAEVIAQLRSEIANTAERDNALLQERVHIMERLGALLDALQSAASGQRHAVESLVNSSAEMLHKVNEEFTGRVATETTSLQHLAAHLTASSTDVSSLGEAFGFAVELFSESSEKFTDTLARIEESLDKSSARNDDQLAYYVAQAREIIDLSMLSQKEIFAELRRLQQPEKFPVEEIS